MVSKFELVAIQKNFNSEIHFLCVQKIFLGVHMDLVQLSNFFEIAPTLGCTQNSILISEKAFFSLSEENISAASE